MVHGAGHELPMLSGEAGVSQMTRNENHPGDARTESTEDHPGADTLSTPSWDEAGTLRWSLPQRPPSLLSAPLAHSGNLEQSH